MNAGRLAQRQRLATAAFVVATIGCGGADNATEKPAEATGATTTSTVTKPITVALVEQNQSGQSGSVTLTDKGLSGTAVVVAMSPPKRFPGDVQPVSINEASCEDLLAFTDYQERDKTWRAHLTEVRGGASETTSGRSLDELTTGRYAISVYQQDHPYAIVACGDIPGGE